jgi:hypothetical protein
MAETEDIISPASTSTFLSSLTSLFFPFALRFGTILVALIAVAGGILYVKQDNLLVSTNIDLHNLFHETCKKPDKNLSFGTLLDVPRWLCRGIQYDKFRLPKLKINMLSQKYCITSIETYKNSIIIFSFYIFFNISIFPKSMGYHVIIKIIPVVIDHQHIIIGHLKNIGSSVPMGSRSIPGYY